MAVRRRLSQGLRALFAFANTPDLALARRHLSPCEFAAFRALSRSEQMHSLNVLRNVLEQDSTATTALIAAALLHDVGKSRYRLAVWQKTLAVVVEALAPSWSRRLSQDERLTFWRAPFVTRRHHARWGGEILRACGADSAVIWLVEHHQDKAERTRRHPLYDQLQRLQLADGAS